MIGFAESTKPNNLCLALNSKMNKKKPYALKESVGLFVLHF